MGTTAADCVARSWNTNSAYGLWLGFLLDSGHMENITGYERITLGHILLK
jgi:hypothetical protein